MNPEMNAIEILEINCEPKVVACSLVCTVGTQSESPRPAYLLNLQRRS